MTPVKLKHESKIKWFFYWYTGGNKGILFFKRNQGSAVLNCSEDLVYSLCVIQPTDWLLMTPKGRDGRSFWCPTYQRFFDISSLLLSVISKETLMLLYSCSCREVGLCCHFHFMDGNWTQFGLVDTFEGTGSWSCLAWCLAQWMRLPLKVHHFRQPTLCNDITPPVEHKDFLHNFIGLFTDSMILLFRH